MAVETTHFQDNYVATGVREEEFAITFDYDPEAQQNIEVFVNESDFSGDNFDVIEDQNGSFKVRIKVGHSLMAGDKVQINRVTELKQNIEYTTGSIVPQKSIVTALDKLTMLVQEKTQIGPGQGQVFDLYSGLTAERARPQATTSQIQTASNTQAGQDANRTIKRNFDILIAPAKFNFSLPVKAPPVYQNPWVAIPDEWDELLFNEGGIETSLWSISQNTVTINAEIYRVYYRIRPLRSGQDLVLVVSRH